MLQRIILLSLFLFSLFGYSQDASLTSKEIRKRVQLTPFWLSRNPKKLVNHLTRDINDNKTKTLVICHWISKNIRYDLKGYTQGRIHSLNSGKVLSKKKALCGEYSQLFKEMTSHIGIQSIIVEGYTKELDFFERDTIYKDQHAWVIVFLEGKWHLVDLTWGAGSIIPRNQFFRRLLWTLFKIPFAPKFKFKKDFNPEWFFIPPQKMLQTHLPTFKRFQLVKVPISMETFQNGSFAIENHLEKFPELDQSPSSIQSYKNLARIDKWKLKKTESKIYNSNNHLSCGYYSLILADSFYRKATSNYTGKILTSVEELNKIIHHSSKSDSLLNLQLQDNETEYNFYKSRSLSWKDSLKTKNTKHKKELRKIYKSNARQIRKVKKIYTKSRSNKNRVKSRLRRIKRKTLDRTKRPGKKNPKKEALAQRLIKELQINNDSLLIIPVLSKKMLSFISKDKIKTALETESQINEIHKNNYQYIKQITPSSRFYELIHSNDYFIEKRYLSENYIRARHLNSQYTSDYLDSIHSKQLESYKLFKAYHLQLSRRLKTIKKLKKNSIQDNGEDSLYANLIQESQIYYAEYIDQLTKLPGTINKLNTPLKRSNRLIKKIIRKIRQDNVIENKRHINYLRFRANIYRNSNKTSSQLKKVALKMKKEALKELQLINKRLKEMNTKKR